MTTFEGLNEEEVSVRFDDTFVDISIRSRDFPIDASVRVRFVPSPGATELMLIGLLLLCCFRRQAG